MEELIQENKQLTFLLDIMKDLIEENKLLDNESRKSICLVCNKNFLKPIYLERHKLVHTSVIIVKRHSLKHLHKDDTSLLTQMQSLILQPSR